MKARLMLPKARWIAISTLLTLVHPAAAPAGDPVSCVEGEPLALAYDQAADCAFEAGTDVDRFSFHGVSGTEIRLLGRSPSGQVNHPHLEVRDPEGTLVHSGTCSSQLGCELALAKDGTHEIAATEPGLDHTGTYEVTLACLFGPCDSDGVAPPDPAPPAIAAQVDVREFDRVTDVDTYEFAGIAGTEIRILARARSGINHPHVEIRDPDGDLLHEGTCHVQTGCEPDSFSEASAPTLLKTGTYRITLSEDGLDHVGTYELGLTCLFGLCDQDADTLLDVVDNCTEWPNADQVDSDGDGFGNRCDADFNDDGFVTITDFGIFGVAFDCVEGEGCYDAQVDLNDDGAISLGDFGILGTLFGKAVGPAGIPRIAYDETVELEFEERIDVDRLEFEGTAGTEIRIVGRSPSGQVNHPRIEIRDPDGVLLHSGTCQSQVGCEPGTFSESPTPTLPKTGTYQVSMSEPGLDHAGTYEITLACLFGPCDSDGVAPEDPAPPLIDYGDTVALDFDHVTDVDRLEFDGAAGTLIRLVSRSPSGQVDHPHVEIRDPDGVLLHSGTCSGQTGCEPSTFSILPTPTLPKTGAYGISITEPGLDHTGTYEVTLACLFGACP